MPKSNKIVARRIVKAIRQSGLRAAEIARQMDLTSQSIHKWTRTGQISKENLIKLEEVTGVDLQDLIHDAIAEQIADLKYIDLHLKIETLTAKEARQVNSFIKKLTK